MSQKFDHDGASRAAAYNMRRLIKIELTDAAYQALNRAVRISHISTRLPNGNWSIDMEAETIGTMERLRRSGETLSDMIVRRLR